ncbi:MAG: family 65 glycosyl hydrolase domain-containing protein [Bacteroidales bacterium]|jgi:maltose phosphorylase|nr:family 65 glycosyl hydrolase domain-containing protein [Bacteroidales bacterium]
MFGKDEWCIIEQGFDAEQNEIAESVCSIGNGHMGQRANFEEQYSGKTLHGNYIGGVFFPDKTRVGWWKNGYPDYFAKVLNAPTWIRIYISVNGEELDLAKAKVLDFTRTLDMHHGILKRSFHVHMHNGVELKVKTQRFVSIVDTEIGAIQYSITPCNKDVEIAVSSCINSDVRNADSNYDEQFWEPISSYQKDRYAVLVDRTKSNPYNVPVFTLATAMCNNVRVGSAGEFKQSSFETSLQKIAEKFIVSVSQGEEMIIEKKASQVSSLNYEEHDLQQAAIDNLQKIHKQSFDDVRSAHSQAWLKKWELSDIIIEGDVAAQQGIRFSIFQLQQTYTGIDSRLNIGPKGFTGEKYGGATYWDTEAFCLPFYLATAPEEVAKNLLVYRYNQLPQAIENAQKLGFTNGAALYPMVTMTGEECHNEWEITFEEIHRNGAIAYAIYNYVQYTDDKGYIIEYGLEVLIAIARFWSQRVNFSIVKKKYVMLGVTGPNEYENNVNNNWYTNYFARWCLQYTLDTISWVKRIRPEVYTQLSQKIGFDEVVEVIRWTDIIKNMFIPYDNQYGIFLQQEGYFDKEMRVADELLPQERPINQHWSWDRILRSCFIKQADVVQGLFMFEHNFEDEIIQKNFDFYEVRCVHESSLSPSVHSVVASKLKNLEKAYELYVRTARLDLDDYNKEAHEGLHITSMAGSWLALVQGFAGMRVVSGKLIFNPLMPQAWKSYSFNVLFRGTVLHISVTENFMSVLSEKGSKQYIVVGEAEYVLNKGEQIEIEL